VLQTKRQQVWRDGQIELQALPLAELRKRAALRDWRGVALEQVVLGYAVPRDLAKHRREQGNRPWLMSAERSAMWCAVSLPAGFASAQKELSRLIRLTFNEFCGSFPFVPFQSLPQGATRRKYEDRDRRTTEGGAPRNETVDIDGNRVFPLYVSIGAKDVVEQPTWRLPGLPTTTGFLTYDEAVAAHASKPAPASTRWAPELKARVED
jgi:hypothetical protein